MLHGLANYSDFIFCIPCKRYVPHIYKIHFGAELLLYVVFHKLTRCQHD